MKHGLRLTAAVMAVLVALSGCYLETENDKDLVILKAEHRVKKSMKGWIAVPRTAPEKKTEGEVTYYLLSTHNHVPAELQGYWAVSPKLYKKLTGKDLPEHQTRHAPVWKMEPGEKVPADKDGWIGMPANYPKIETKDGGAGLGVLSEDQLIPAEMDGWTAFDKETMAKLAADRELKSGTIKKKD